MLLVDSHPGGVRPLPRDRQTRRGLQPRRRLGDAADYGYCASHSRYFYGLRLHTLFAPDGTPRAMALTSPKIDEKRRLPADARALSTANPGSAHPDRRQELPRRGVRDRPRHARTPRSSDPAAKTNTDADRISRRSANGSRSIYWTAKDILTLERHGARTLHGLRARIASRLLTLAAAVSLNHQLGRPSRALAPTPPKPVELLVRSTRCSRSRSCAVDVREVLRRDRELVATIYRLGGDLDAGLVVPESSCRISQAARYARY